LRKNSSFSVFFILVLLLFSCKTGENKKIEAITGASPKDAIVENDQRGNLMNATISKSLIIVHSYHTGSTGKVADAIANILDSDIKQPQEVNLHEIQNFELVGFGSGIFSDKHSDSIINLANELPVVNDKKAYIFSTSSIIKKDKNVKDHSVLKEILLSKGYIIIGEFHCLGYNRNSFLKIFGGINKRRPNEEDLENARKFALELRANMGL